MRFFSANHRVALALISILVSVKLLVICAGFGPDVRRASMLGREKLCDSMGIHASLLMSSDDTERVEAMLSAMVERNDDLLSAALRQADGELVVRPGDQGDREIGDELPTTATPVQVPVWAGKQKWGTVELRFRPISPQGISAIVQNPWTTHVALTAMITFVLFSMYLRRVLHQRELSQANPNRVQTTHPKPLPRLPKATLPPSHVLVVDDGESNRQLVSLFLRRSGADVSVANNGQVAVEMAVAHHFDAILMDMHMPVMDGFTATKRLRQMGCATPIIALTANVMEVDERKCLAAGCTRFLRKPIDMGRLASTLAEFLGETDAETAIRPVQSTVDQQLPEGRAVDALPPQDDVQAAIGHCVHPAVAEPSHELPSDGPIFSSLPADDDEFREIVAGFIDRLDQRVVEMREAYEEGDLEQLAHQAHWLKGAGGMVGFELFTAPAASMQESAENGRPEVEGFLREIEAITRRIQHPGVNSALATTDGDSADTFHSAQTEEVV